MKFRILIFAALLLLPVLALAQASTAPPAMATPHPSGRGPDLGMWWKNSEVVRQLQLSDAQISQIEQTFLEARLKLIDLRADVERQETLLQPLVDADQLDEAKTSAQLDKVLAARARLEKANMMMMLDIRKVLTAEQWKKLRDLHLAHAAMAGPHGPGPGQGPGGTPPSGGPQGPGPGGTPPPDRPDEL